MREDEIRSAFDHLTRDVMANVKTEERLEQMSGRPRLRWKPAVAALGAAAVVALVIGAAILATLPGGDPDPGPPATGVTTSSLVDTPIPVTPTTVSPAASPGQVLIADPAADVIVPGDGYTAYLAERVIGDGGGGIIVQIEEQFNQISPAGDSRTLVRAADLAADQGPVTIRLEDIAVVDGSPRVLFVVDAVGTTWLESYEEVWWYDLDSGASGPIYVLEPAFESTITRVSQAGDVVVVSIAFEGGTYFEYVDADGQRIEVAGPYGDLPGGAPEYPVLIEQAVLSPDGSTFAYVEVTDFTTLEDGYLFVDVVVWNLANGTEDERVTLELGAWPGRLDYDGVGVVLGRYRSMLEGREGLAPLRIESLADGTVTELPEVGTPSLVKSFD